ncbi:MAG TPA: gliding motility-associated ABC transporter substrate-binding protein GldG [Flavipsychrobacter sp.]|nr:gliding motility-associated ABC transporter substrate-binding protein GldG [Flavipsychrobacter sp.]
MANSSNTSKKRKQQRRQAALRLIIMLAILVCMNMLAVRINYSLDLTREKRFTLSPSTKNLLRNMKDVAVIEVYLKGTFPAGFQRLAEETRERLESFKEYAGPHIVFKFVNPVEGKTEKEKEAIYEEMSSKGLELVNLHEQGEEEGYSEKIIFPDALVKYQNRELPISLLESHGGMTPFEKLNASEAMLEYKFANAIHKLSLPDVPSIGYIVGNGEALGINTIDALTTLARHYHLDTIDIQKRPYISSRYDAIIIDQPTIPFDDKDKFKIDQYVMNGGHVLWYLDMLHASMDSLNNSQEFMPEEYNLNLDDMLFKYGVRVNNDLVEDMNSLPLPVQTAVGGVPGSSPQYELRNWIYFPVFLPVSKHPIVSNMEPVMGMFVNSIDTIADPGIKKTILLQSSKYSRVESYPLRVSFGMVMYPLKQEMFNKPNRPTAVLLEGKFRSIFLNRLPGSFLHILRDSLKYPFRPGCDSTNSMIVVSDGNMMQNDYSAVDGPYEMGYWRFTKEFFANKNFMLNCVEYLTDHSGILEARSKTLQLRLLDQGRVKDEKSKWQIINIAIPIAIVLIFASCYLFFRKRRYETKA